MRKLHSNREQTLVAEPYFASSHSLLKWSQNIVIKMGIACQNFTNHRISQNRILAFDWVSKTIGCLAEPEVPFSVVLGTSGIQGISFYSKYKNVQLSRS